MALDFLGPIFGGIATGVMNSFKDDPVGSFAGLVQTGLGVHGAMNPQQPYPPELIEEMIDASREGRRLSRESFDLARQGADQDRQITGARLQGLGRSQQMLAAGLNSNDPVFQRLHKGETSTIKRDFVDALNEYRNHRQRYGEGIVNPSRRDETIARTATRGFEDAQQKARDNVRNYLMATAEANRAVAATYGGGGGMNYQPASTAGLSGAMTAIGANRGAAAEGRETGFANIVGGLSSLSQKPKETPRGSTGFDLSTGSRPKYNWPGQDHNNPMMN